jgi:hypothetical protein
MKKKICVCKEENAFYYDFGMYKCQYCNGLLTDLERVRKIIDANTSIKIDNRDKEIEKELMEHKKFIEL